MYNSSNLNFKNISHVAINEMLKHVLNYEEEICMNMVRIDKGEKGEKGEKYDFNYKSAVLGKGVKDDRKESGERKSCSHKKYTKVIYHSHPLRSRSYPSVEDILKVMKIRDTTEGKEDIEVSVISTRWGVYILEKTFQSLEMKHFPQFIDKEIRNTINQIGFMENEKGFKKGNFSLNLKDDELDLITKQLSYLESITFLKCSFCPWKDFAEMGIIKKK